MLLIRNVFHLFILIIYISVYLFYIDGFRKKIMICVKIQTVKVYFPDWEGDIFQLSVDKIHLSNVQYLKYKLKAGVFVHVVIKK